jgi:hypothetical protein
MKIYLVMLTLMLSVPFISCTETKYSKYQCPMKCEKDKTYDKPGKCPVCEMDLEGVK